ncbi:MAG: apolipoprotein N-acyltransferase [Gammaproteobacteria bacterium]|nr:apolipoprotein N-acyltransferase [Gammaproteobacteria bacterium]
MPLCFAPFGAWWLAPLLLAAWWLWSMGNLPRTAAADGFCFGLGMFGVGISWVYNSLHDFGDAHPFVAGFITVALILTMAAYFAAFSALAAYLRKRIYDARLYWLVAIPVLWLLTEWLRSYVLTGFPWLLMGYGQAESPLGAFLPVIGVFGCGALVALCAASIALWVSTPNYWSAALISLGGLLLLTFALQDVQWTQLQNSTKRVALVQGNLGQEIKLGAQGLPISQQRYAELSATVGDVDILLWPETALPAFQETVQPYLQTIQTNLHTLPRHGHLLTGIFFYERSTGVYYNSLLVVDTKQAYHKQRLVPFGEYMPLRGLLAFMNRFVQIPMSDIDNGPAQQSPLLVGDVDVGVTICYESAYDEVYREQLPKADFLVNVSNDAWFGDSLAPYQHLQIAQTRARESGRYLLRATNTGITAMITPQGAVTSRLASFQAGVLIVDVPLLMGATPYVRLGHYLLLFCVIAALVGGFYYQRFCGRAAKQ